jgi:hypothetical protein
VAAATPWHPNIFARPADEVVRGFGAWTLLHLLLMLAVILALFGASGLVAAHRGRIGRLGQVGLAVTVVGVAAAASVAAIEAVVFPLLARSDPTLLALSGPLLTSPILVALGILALGWPTGLALLGLAAARSRSFPRAPGILLALSAPLFLALEGPFIPVLGPGGPRRRGGGSRTPGRRRGRTPRSPADQETVNSTPPSTPSSAPG